MEVEVELGKHNFDFDAVLTVSKQPAFYKVKVVLFCSDLLFDLVKILSSQAKPIATKLSMMSFAS